MEKSIITITGGTGYIASWIVNDLLQQGHDVRITVRDKKNTEKYGHLLNIAEKSPGTLTVYQANLLEKDSFDEAVNGVDYVMHTASPFIQDDEGDTQAKLIDPAVNGTKNLLASVNKSTSVKRVILTSSLAAIYSDNRDMRDKHLESLDESIWNDSSSLTHNAYSFSKTSAEKAAWDIVGKQNNWDMVTIHPGFVMGPSLTKRVDSTSINTLLRILKGEFKSGVPDLEFIFSDVRDISKGHIAAAFSPHATGRYIISNQSGSLLTMGRIIEKAYPGTYKVPKRMIPKWLVWILAPSIGFTRQYVSKNIGFSIKADNSRSIKELGLEYLPLEKTVLDHVDQVKKDNLIY